MFKTNDTPKYNSTVHSYDLILYTLICPLTPLPFFLIRQYNYIEKVFFSHIFSHIYMTLNFLHQIDILYIKQNYHPERDQSSKKSA